MNKAVLKWSPAAPIRKPDNIISSKAREKNLLGFKPSYENEPQEHMCRLLSNEYMRVWFRERAVYEKDTYTREKIIKEENKIKRRFVQRMMTYRKPTKNQFIDDTFKEKKLKNKSAQQTQNYQQMKYKPECSLINKGKNENGPIKFKKQNTTTEVKKNVTEDDDGSNQNDTVLEAEIFCDCK